MRRSSSNTRPHIMSKESLSSLIAGRFKFEMEMDFLLRDKLADKLIYKLLDQVLLRLHDTDLGAQVMYKVINEPRLNAWPWA